MGSTMFAGAALAAATGDTSLVTAAKARGPRSRAVPGERTAQNRDVAGAEGTAALVWAATRNDLAMADLLLKAGANAKGTNEFGATALYAAAAHADPAMAAKLIAGGADANKALLSGETAAHGGGSSRGNLATVRALLASRRESQHEGSRTAAIPL